MEAKKRLVTNWFVEPEDAHTNEITAKSLLTLNQLNESFALEDNEGQEHSVFQIETYSFITTLYKNRTASHLNFKVFYRTGKDGPIRLWKLGSRKKVSKKVSKVVTELKQKLKVKK